MNIRNKFKEWFKRYWLAEFVSYSLAIGGGTTVFYLTGSYYISGIVVIVGDNLGYYLTMFIREIIHTRKKQGKYHILLLLKDIRNLSFDYTIPQYIETFVTYPLIVFYVPQLFYSYPFGIFLAMTISVLIFYIQVIFLYEFRKKYFK